MVQNGIEQRCVIGILGAFTLPKIDLSKTRTALQGAFAEHQTALQRLPCARRLEVILVKTPEDLERCDALVIPGGGVYIFRRV